MGKKNITSHNQKGGITTYEVNIKQSGSTNTITKIKDLPLWVKCLVAICTIGAFIVAIIFGVLNLVGGG